MPSLMETPETQAVRALRDETIRLLSPMKDRLDAQDAVLKSWCEQQDAKFRRFVESRALPTVNGDPDAPRVAQPLLDGHKEFLGWVAGPRGQKSSFNTSVAFNFEAKATPILNTGGTVHTRRVFGPQQPSPRLVELLPTIPLSMGAAVEYTQETSFTPGAAVVPEGTLKPETVLAFQNKLATIQTIATILKASLQSLADTPGLRQWLDARLRLAVMLKAEDLFLNTASTGLLAVASPLDAGYTPGAGATPLDYIGAAIGQLQALGYSVDGIVLAGPDAAAMRLLKTSTGEYIWASPDAALGVPAVWSVPVVISPSMAAGTFLVGAFGQATALFQRQLLNVEIAYENEDDFVKNLACLRAEERAALAIPVPAGLVKGTFTPAG